MNFAWTTRCTAKTAIDSIRWKMDDLFDEDDAEGTDIALDELGLIEGQKFSLHYDFGDDWMFAIRVMKIEEVKKHRKLMLLSSKGSVEQYPEGEE